MENEIAQVGHIETLVKTQVKADNPGDVAMINNDDHQKVNGNLCDESEILLPDAANHTSEASSSKLPEAVSCPMSTMCANNIHVPSSNHESYNGAECDIGATILNSVSSDGQTATTGICEAVSQESSDSVVNGVESEGDKSTEDSTDDGWVYVLGHGQLKKRTIKPGEENSRPEKGQVVTVRCVGRLDDGTEVDVHDSLRLCLGDDDFITAFDLCIPLMDKGELCQVVTESRFAYGEFGREPDIPANARITYDIEILQIEDLPPFDTLTVAYRVKLSNEKRERGNALYTRGEHSRAVDVYNRALQIVNDESEVHTETADELESLSDTRVKCYNNLAAAQLKVEAWDAAIRSCDLALRADPDNVKALFRKGKCLAGKGDYDAAVLILRHALKLEPDSKIIKHELSRVDMKLRESNRSQKELFQKMLGTDKLKAPVASPKAAEDTKTKQRQQWRNTQWIWYVVGALGAAIIPAALTAYRYIYLTDEDN